MSYEYTMPVAHKAKSPATISTETFLIPIESFFFEFDKNYAAYFRVSRAQTERIAILYSTYDSRCTYDIHYLRLLSIRVERKRNIMNYTLTKFEFTRRTRHCFVHRSRSPLHSYAPYHFIRVGINASSLHSNCNRTLSTSILLSLRTECENKNDFGAVSVQHFRLTFVCVQ